MRQKIPGLFFLFTLCSLWSAGYDAYPDTYTGSTPESGAESEAESGAESESWFSFAEPDNYSKSKLSLGTELVLPLQPGNGIGWGVTARLKLYLVSIGLDVQLVGKQYYDYVAGEWVGPTSWGNIHTSSSPFDWLFYNDIIVPNLFAAFHLPLGWLQPYAGGGICALLVLPNANATDSYPGFADYYANNSRNIARNIGVFLTGGCDFFLGNRFIALGAQFIYRFDQLLYIPESFRTYGAMYLLSCAHLLFNVSCWI